MLTIYSSRTHSYHLMANWLKDHQMPYRERIFTPKQPLTRKEIFYLLSLTENGFDDLLAKLASKLKRALLQGPLSQENSRSHTL